MKPDTKIVKVVGVTFVRTYPANLLQLQDLIDWQLAVPAKEVEPLSVVLRRNPNNEHDANAIEVHVPALGDEGMIGHIKADHAAILAPMMDAGQRFASSVYKCNVRREAPAKPGIEIQITRLKESK